MYNTFENIAVWRKSRELTKHIYDIFKSNKDYSFRDQIQRASISLMNNIAEGFERKTQKEFAQFLYIAKGSSGEVRSMLHIAVEIDYIAQAQFEELYKQATEISRMLSGFIKKL